MHKKCQKLLREEMTWGNTWQDNNKTDLGKKKCKNVNGIKLDQDRI
jgi:hypothetical protein